MCLGSENQEEILLQTHTHAPSHNTTLRSRDHSLHPANLYSSDPQGHKGKMRGAHHIPVRQTIRNPNRGLVPLVQRWKERQASAAREGGGAIFHLGDCGLIHVLERHVPPGHGRETREGCGGKGSIGARSEARTAGP
jgi:hypothetical protein